MISHLPFGNSLARFWSAVTYVDQPKLINNGPNTPLNVNKEDVASSGGSLNHLCKVYLTDAHGTCDQTLNLSELTEETSHLFVAADCPLPLIMSLKSALPSWTPITIIGNETRQNLMSMFAELPGFGVFRGSLISESFCSKLTTSTDSDKHEAVSSYVASIYSKTDSTIRILFPEHNTCQTKLISKLREKGINENMETLKSSKESLDSASQKRILFDRYRSTIKHFTDGSLPEKDEIRIYMTPPNSIEALQKVMVRCSAYQNAPSAVVIMYNHEEAYRIRNEKILHMASPELLLELLSKIQKSPEGPQLNQLRISKKEFGKQFETAWESAQYLLRDLQVRGILKMEGSYPSEFEIKLSKVVQSSVSNPDFFEFLLSRTKLDGESITSISHTYFSGNLESETISSAVSQSKSPAQVPIQTNTETPLLPRLSAFKQAMTDLNNEGCFSQMRPSEVVIFFKKLDSVSSPELTAAFFSQHEETTLRIKAVDFL